MYRFTSYHRGIILDFNTNHLFGRPHFKLFKWNEREFKSNDTTAVKTYIESKHAYLSDHNFNSRLQHLATQWDTTTAESLDRDFQWASSHAANQCRRTPNLEYTKKIADLRMEKNNLLFILSSHSNNIDMSQSLQFHASSPLPLNHITSISQFQT